MNPLAFIITSMLGRAPVRPSPEPTPQHEKPDCQIDDPAPRPECPECPECPDPAPKFTLPRPLLAPPTRPERERNPGARAKAEAKRARRAALRSRGA